MERAIIHLNIVDFAVAVERQCDSRLRRRPVIIAGSSPRAPVYDMSDEAYQRGIRKGMPLRQATRLCREALLVPPHPGRYEKAAHLLLQQAQPYSPLVEVTDSNGHLFLDVTACGKLFGPAPDIAWRLRKSVRRALGIEPIWTVAPSKLMAKFTSRLVKPRGEYIAAAGKEEKILAPCPLTLLPGLEPSDIDRLQQFNITRIGELAALSVTQLTIPFGRRAGYLHELAHGIDCTPVLPPGRKPPILVQEHRFADGSNDQAQVENALFLLAEKAGSQLRRQGLATGKITLRLSYTDGADLHRQANLQPPPPMILSFSMAPGNCCRRPGTGGYDSPVCDSPASASPRRRQPNSPCSANNTANRRCCCRPWTPSAAASGKTASDGEEVSGKRKAARNKR